MDGGLAAGRRFFTRIKRENIRVCGYYSSGSYAIRTDVRHSEKYGDWIGSAARPGCYIVDNKCGPIIQK